MATIKDRLQSAAAHVAHCKTELVKAQDEFDALYKQVTGIKQRKQKVEAPDLMTQNLNEVDTSPTHIRAMLDTEPLRQWSLDDIRLKLPEIPRASIRVHLYKLQNDGHARKVGRGKWQSATTNVVALESSSSG